MYQLLWRSIVVTHTYTHAYTQSLSPSLSLCVSLSPSPLSACNSYLKTKIKRGSDFASHPALPPAHGYRAEMTAVADKLIQHDVHTIEFLRAEFVYEVLRPQVKLHVRLLYQDM